MKRTEQKTTELVCEKGISFCNTPPALSEYYPLIRDSGNMPGFAELEISDKPVADNNKKQCAKRLKIRAKFSFARLMQASVDPDYEKIGGTRAKEIKKWQ